MHVFKRRVIASVALISAVIVGVSAVIVGASASVAQGVVELHLRGRYYSEPATIRVTITVEPDSENRTLVVEADGDRLFRSSHVALDGENGQRLHTVEFKNLPAGQYLLRAAVHSSAEVRGVAEEVLFVGEADHER